MNYFNFNNSYTYIDDRLFTQITPDSVPSPKLVVFYSNLAKELGIADRDFTEFLSGNRIPEGSTPIAQAYAGHQFGQLNVLGDGRAVLLGEHVTKDKLRFDIALKGSGRTPYSRNGDGKATLYSMLREYLISFAMEKLGIPTTKSLAVVETGETVYREQPNRGAVLTRVASSHIRVGTFQYVAMQGDRLLLKKFADYTIDRHYPELNNHLNKYLEFFTRVMDTQINLIINWMRVGFIHGVMNTDNVSISGETIDYGPCAFMNNYNPDTVFSSIDRYGRYSFMNQRSIGKWNIARFAETLIVLINPDTDKALELLNGVINTYDSIFTKRWYKMMGNKLGLSQITEQNYQIIDNLLKELESKELDYTQFFRTLAENRAENIDENIKESWLKLNPDFELIKKTNPAVIPRNHIVEEVLKEAAYKGNYDPFNDFLKVLEEPYKDRTDSYTLPPDVIDKSYRTFCGT